MNSSPPKVAFFNNSSESFQNKPGSAIDHVYGDGRKERIEALADVYPELITESNFDEHADALADVEVVFSTWGFPSLSEAQIEKLSSLRIIFYAAGATPFRPSYTKRGVTVCSASAANALPVAEFVLMQILMSATNIVRHMAACTSEPSMQQQWFDKGRGAYGTKVTLLGKGSIAKHLLKLMEPFDFDVRIMGSREIMQNPEFLEEAFKGSDIVSNHLPDRDDNKKILSGRLFKMMPQGACFINTGRGAQVDEQALSEVFTARPDLTAYLDVQHPEPPLADSPLYTTPNIHLSLHIAGALNRELLRMSDYMIEEFQRWMDGEPLQHAVSDDML